MKTLHILFGIGCACASVLSSAQEIRASVNGETVEFKDVQPTMIHGHVMVPVRGIFEKMGITMSWDAANQTVAASHGKTNMTLTLNSRFATINNEQVPLDASVKEIAGRTMVPLRFLSESLGAKVEWVEQTRTVEITTQPLALVGQLYVKSNPGSVRIALNPVTRRGSK